MESITNTVSTKINNNTVAIFMCMFWLHIDMDEIYWRFNVG